MKNQSESNSHEHGYDGKQVSHQERELHAMIKYADGES